MKLRRVILAAIAAASAGAASAETVACDLQLNITDQDPAGLNVRASPAGAVIAAVKAKNRWVRVDVTGADGAWARIKTATMEADENDSVDHSGPLWKGVGWVAFSKLGISYFEGPTQRILAAPSDRARVLLSFKADDSTGPSPEAILGCDGHWLKVRVQGVVGWTDAYCTNELTTCV